MFSRRDCGRNVDDCDLAERARWREPQELVFMLGGPVDASLTEAERSSFLEDQEQT
jgi:hypothetical protein